MGHHVLFREVCKNYSVENSATALRSLSFMISPGEFTAIAGPSGSGKTTVLNLAAGLDTPTSGTIFLLGRDLGRMAADELTTLRRGSTGFVFQAHNLLPVLTALENVEYPLALLGAPRRERKERARQALSEVGLEAHGDRFPSQLSGGQQQRVAVARAIITDPEIIFADEPTASLDSVNAEQIITLFRQINERRGTTFLFSSHDPIVLHSAGRVISLVDGRIKENGDVSRPALVVAPRRTDIRGVDGAIAFRH